MSHLHEPRDWLAPGSQSPSPTFGNFGVPKTLLLNTAFSWGVVSNRAGVGKAQGSQRWEERHAPELPGVDGLGVGLREQELNDPLVGRATLQDSVYLGTYSWSCAFTQAVQRSNRKWSRVRLDHKSLHYRILLYPIPHHSLKSRVSQSLYAGD